MVVERSCRDGSRHGAGTVRAVSEYQHYEFLAIDRPLTGDEQAEVRALSERAEITATGFTDTYEWGDFGGDPERMMERFYDAHLYVTDWGTHRLMLRLPGEQLPLRTVQPYCLDEHVRAWATDTHLLLDLTSEDEGGDWVDGADEAMAALIGTREELAAGDLRPLYLAWLSALGAWELEDDDEEEYQSVVEPPVPAGLDRLTGPQRALADFLRVDDALLAVAAEGNPDTVPASGDSPSGEVLAALIAALPETEKNDLLLRLALGHPEPLTRAELLHRLDGVPGPGPVAVPGPGRRSAAQLLDAAHEHRQVGKLRAVR
jgi:hypothetical protein